MAKLIIGTTVRDIPWEEKLQVMGGPGKPLPFWAAGNPSRMDRRLREARRARGKSYH